MENQIDLFETSDKALKKDSKRPSKLDLSGLQTHRQKWAECKIYGKNIMIRSYAGACAIATEYSWIHTAFYIYGGLQILNGVLADFHKICIKPEQNLFQWVNVEAKNSDYSPGPRAKHSLVAHQNKIYLIAGIKSALETTN